MTGGYTGDDASAIDKSNTDVRTLHALQSGNAGVIDSRWQTANADQYAKSCIASAAPMNVSVHNYGEGKVKVDQLSPTELRLVVGEEIQKQTPKLFRSELSNPNSTIPGRCV